MNLRVLGPVEVWSGGRALVTTRPQQAAVLAALAVDANHLVRSETLIDRIWGDEPPERARRTLHTHLSRVRRLLEQGGAPTVGGARLLRRPSDYLLDVDSERVDLHRYRRLVDRAGGCGSERVTLLREAMGLWRGDPLAGVPGEWAALVRQAWRQHHLSAAVSWARAEVEVGNPAAVIGPLTMLVGEYPLTECLVGVLMRALHAAGHTAAALEHYARVRRRLVTEIGIEPGAALSAAHQAVLRGPAAVPEWPLG